jgi:hypothetical protein
MFLLLADHPTVKVLVRHGTNLPKDLNIFIALNKNISVHFDIFVTS